VDIEPTSRRRQDKRWLFVQGDDIEFAKTFPTWCRENGLPTEIDILFIDTSHFFEHTVQEIAHWFPLLAPRGKVFFHDTNLRRIYFRKDGSMGVAWSNRGVIGALEKFFSKSFNEREDFTDSISMVGSSRNYAQCSGFTILTRNPLEPENIMPASSLLTVVLIAGNNRQRAQRILRSVLEQDIAEKIVIFVFDRADKPARDLPELNQLNVVYQPVDKSTTLGQLRARATRMASTEVIAFIEEHVAIPSGWARESLRRHSEGYAGVSGMVTAGNPHHRWARIVFSITYGSYALPTQGGDSKNSGPEA
jgi:hypothetical protein